MTFSILDDTQVYLCIYKTKYFMLKSRGPYGPEGQSHDRIDEIVEFIRSSPHRNTSNVSSRCYDVYFAPSDCFCPTLLDTKHNTRRYVACFLNQGHTEFTPREFTGLP